jgi:endonuclease/exonuclease/phosphatase family metal-dependent hydrolase
VSVLDPVVALPSLPDIVTLQEVTLEHACSVRERLQGLGYSNTYSGDARAAEKRYGNIIAARMPLSLSDFSATDLPWPQLVAHAVVSTEAGPVNVITVHVPNGSGNGWRKIMTLEALKQMILGLEGQPVILTGDFNEPRWVPLQNGRIVTWGQDEHNGRWLPWSTWTCDGITGTGERWDRAVRWFFEYSNESGVRNAFWESAGRGAMEATHLSRGAERWFDHVFVSDCFQVCSCRYLHSFREDGYSDHSGEVAALLYGKACS